MENQENSGEKPVGLTKDNGWQVGARKTVDAGVEKAWQTLVSKEGLEIWLGDIPGLADGDEFSLADGTACQIRVFKPNSHLRMGWQPPAWERSSTIQVRVVPSGTRTVLAFHQENMPSQEARQRRRAFYKKALNQLALLLRD